MFAIRPHTPAFDEFWYRHSLFRQNFPIATDEYSSTWDYITQIFGAWLNGVVKPHLDEISTPDLWHILQETRSYTKHELGTPKDFESFSAEENTQIRLSINDFRLLIVENFNPNNEELKAIDTRLKYLSDALDKHNKFDWKGIAINTVIAIIIALSLNQEQGNQLFQLFKQVFSNFLYLLASA